MIKSNILVLWGGGLDGIGNINPNGSAEFNIWIDPHAAHFILTSPTIASKCILSPLNLTHKAIATEYIIEEGIYPPDLRHQKLRTLFFELFEFFKKTYRDNQGFKLGPPLHDPMTLFPLLQFYKYDSQDVINFKYARMDLDVITDLSDPDAGMIIPNKEYEDNSENKGVMVGYDINIDYFWAQIIDCLNFAQESSTIED